jgi:recombinational DNA repair protein (RecF pathway)
MSINKQVIYALECDHAAPGPATLVSGTLHCAWCQEQKLITGVSEYEWRAVCHHCTYRRWAGMSKHNAGVMLNGHIRRNTRHEGHVEYARNPTATETAQKMRAWKGKAAG